MEDVISHIHFREDDIRLDSLQDALGSIRRAHQNWHGVPSARLYDLRSYGDLLFVRKGGTRRKLSEMRGLRFAPRGLAPEPSVSRFAPRGLDAEPSGVMKCPYGLLRAYDALVIIGNSVRTRRMHLIRIGHW